jgi:hypothetical protein
MSTAIESERDYKDSRIANHSGKDVEQIEATSGERLHVGQLSAEELEIEKKLLKKIDFRIMPVVITIYLMNYIDRCVWSLLLRSCTDL